jgi:GNAT superfamily N-acetyltransferase
MEFVDKALARRLESAEEMPQVEYAKIYQKQRPEIGAAVEEICGGHMIFAGLNSPIGRAVGMGFDKPVTSSDLDRIEQFYRSRGAPAQLDICPFNAPELLGMLQERGYAMAELNNVLYCRLQRVQDPAPLPSGVEIRPAARQEAEIFSNIVARSFHDDGAIPDGFADLFMPLFHIPTAITFLASVEGEPVAGGAGLLIGDHGVVALSGAGTLPAFRKRGLQTALLQRRKAAAASSGCEFAVIVTQGGTISQRNAERLGFRVAYSKATVIKKW